MTQRRIPQPTSSGESAFSMPRAVRTAEGTVDENNPYLYDLRPYGYSRGAGGVATRPLGGNGPLSTSDSATSPSSLMVTAPLTGMVLADFRSVLVVYSTQTATIGYNISITMPGANIPRPGTSFPYTRTGSISLSAGQTVQNFGYLPEDTFPMYIGARSAGGGTTPYAGFPAIPQSGVTGSVSFTTPPAGATFALVNYYPLSLPFSYATTLGATIS